MIGIVPMEITPDALPMARIISALPRVIELLEEMSYTIEETDGEETEEQFVKRMRFAAATDKELVGRICSLMHHFAMNFGPYKRLGEEPKDSDAAEVAMYEVLTTIEEFMAEYFRLHLELEHDAGAPACEHGQRCHDSYELIKARLNIIRGLDKFFKEFKEDFDKLALEEVIRYAASSEDHPS